MSKLGVVIVAAGRGSRMKAEVSKQYLLLAGKPILLHTLQLFHCISEVNDIVVVVGADEVALVRDWREKHGLSKVKSVVSGGSERQHSVYRGLLELSDDIVWTMVHDGVRPLVTVEAVQRLRDGMTNTGAAVLAVPVKDTIKSVDAHGIIESTPDRAKLWAIQTPQAFPHKKLIEAHEQALAEGFLGTDDAMIMERIGVKVQVVEGNYDNIKITTPDDLVWAESILANR